MNDKTNLVAGALPERDTTRAAEQQGLFRKFDVRRVDGSDQLGGKHHGCRYYVLDVDHDPYAAAALGAYADACKASHPELARDLREKWGAADTIDTLRAQLAEAQREAVTLAQYMYNEIDTLRAQLAEAQREAVTLAQYMYNACYSHEPDYASGKVKWEPCDTPAGVITQIDNMVAGVRAQLAEAQRDSERLDWMIEQRAYVVSDPDCCDGYWLNYARPDGTTWTQATEHETPRAVIDAAKGEPA